MLLEDHAGDLVRKAREALGIPLRALAEQSGWTAAALEALEAGGRAPEGADWDRLGAPLGLAGGRLARIAAGWHPREPDLSLWRELRRITTEAEGIRVHCHLVWDEVSREAALFDTGWDADPVLQLLEANGLLLRHLFLTHSHPDHLQGLQKVRAAFPKALLHTSSRQAPPQHRNRANDFIHLGSLRITHRETPGHTEDSVVYVVGNWPEDAPHAAFVGDALFAGSMGQPHTSLSEALQGVREKIFSLPPETLLCPGHGPFTTVEEEKSSNPWFP